MKARTIVFVAIILTFSACGVAAKIDARNDLEQSKITYKPEYVLCQINPKRSKLHLRTLLALLSMVERTIVAH